VAVAPRPLRGVRAVSEVKDVAQQFIRVEAGKTFTLKYPALFTLDLPRTSDVEYELLGDFPKFVEFILDLVVAGVRRRLSKEKPKAVYRAPMGVHPVDVEVTATAPVEITPYGEPLRIELPPPTVEIFPYVSGVLVKIMLHQFLPAYERKVPLTPPPPPPVPPYPPSGCLVRFLPHLYDKRVSVKVGESIVSIGQE